MNGTTVRICRFCGRFARLESWEHRQDEPWGCAGCIRHVIRYGAHIPGWVIRASRGLRVIS